VISDDTTRRGAEREPIHAPCGFMGSVDLHCTAAPGMGPARGTPAQGSALTAIVGMSSSAYAVSQSTSSLGRKNRVESHSLNDVSVAAVRKLVRLVRMFLS
jgi:hypothetical protein